MNDNIHHSKAFENLSELLMSRFGKKLRMKPIIVPKDHNKMFIQNEIQEYDLKQEESVAVKYFFEKGALQIPILNSQNSNDQVLALAEVMDAEKLSRETIHSIVHLVQMILGPIFYKKNLDLQLQAPQRFNKKFRVVKDIELGNPSNQMDNKDHFLVIQSTNLHTLNRFSFIIHELKENWSFVRFQDISNHVKCLDDIRELFHCTLLIENLNDLSAFHFDLLSKYFELNPNETDPLVIIGNCGESDLNYDDTALLVRRIQKFSDQWIVATEFPIQNEHLKRALAFYI